MTSILRVITCLAVVATLSACNPPRGTILQSEIVKEAKREDANFTVISVERESVKRIASWPATGTSLALSWPGKGHVSRGLRVGDKVNLTIWDSQQNSLLAAGEQRSVPMTGLVINPAGSIFIPYIEEVKVAGMTPEAARSEIQTRMSQIAPSAQVMLDVEQGGRNSIELVSGVQKPGRYPIGADGTTILSALAEAGGIPDAMRNPVVRLQRGGQSYATLAKDIYRTPGRDILLRGDDRIIVEADPRAFLVLGAAGAEKTVPFEKTSHNLLEALSLSNGLQESRVNLRAVLVLRNYPEKAVRKDGKGPPSPQVIFTFDLASGEGLFAARNFKIYPDDVVLPTESSIPSTTSALSIFGTTLGLVQRASDM